MEPMKMLHCADSDRLPDIVRCSLLNQQAFCLEKEFEVDYGFHRTPLVPGCLEALQYVSPGVASWARA
jgi:hypothetical protein